MRARRIGANELDTIGILAGYVEAQKEYAAEDRDNDGLLEYAQRIMSSPGRHDGLYWEGTPQSLVPKEFAEAEQGERATPFNGYYFRVLKAQGTHAQGGRHNYLVKECMIGGFAVLASPAQYGVTGVHSFIVNQDGVIYEKDIKRLAPVTTYDPDKSWTRVD